MRTIKLGSGVQSDLEETSQLQTTIQWNGIIAEDMTMVIYVKESGRYRVHMW